MLPCVKVRVRVGVSALRELHAWMSSHFILHAGVERGHPPLRARVGVARVLHRARGGVCGDGQHAARSSPVWSRAAGRAPPGLLGVRRVHLLGCWPAFGGGAVG